MGSVRLHLESIFPVLLSILIVLQIVKGQQCNCKNPVKQNSHGNEKLNGMLLKQLNQLRDNANFNTQLPNLQQIKQSMPSMGSLSQGQNAKKNKQSEMQIPISSIKTMNGNSDSAQRGPSLNLGLLQNPSAPNNKGGISELKINKFQFIPNTPNCPCNKKTTPQFEAQMLPIPLAVSPEASDNPPSQNQVLQLPTSSCPQISQYNMQNQANQVPVNCASNMNVPQNIPLTNMIAPQSVEHNILMPPPAPQQLQNLNTPAPEGQAGQGQNQPQIVYLVLPQPQQPAALPQYTPQMYYAPAQTSSKSLSMKSLLPLLLEMLQEKKNCGCQNCPHCGSLLNQDQSMFGGYANKNMYGVTENCKEIDSEKIKTSDKNSSEDTEKQKESAEHSEEKSAAIAMPKKDKSEKEAEKSTEYLDPEFEDESLEDISVEKE